MTYAEAVTRRERIMASYVGVIPRIRPLEGSWAVMTMDRRGDESVPPANAFANMHVAPVFPFKTTALFDSQFPAV